MALNSTPATWTPGEIPTAAKMNAEIRDALTGLQAAWTNYTPSWIATSGAPDIGNGVLNGKALQVGRRMDFRIELQVGSDTQFGSGVYSFTLPATATGMGRQVFSGLLRDASAASNYPAFGLLDAGGGVIAMRVLPTTAGGPFANMSGTSPITLAAGDQIIVSGSYEVIA